MQKLVELREISNFLSREGSLNVWSKLTKIKLEYRRTRLSVTLLSSR